MSLLARVTSLAEAPLRTARKDKGWSCCLCDMRIRQYHEYRDCGKEGRAHGSCVREAVLKIKAAGEAGIL